MSLDIALRAFAASVADVDGRAGAVPLRFSLGTVASVTAGAATDGNAQITVTVGSSTQLAPYDSGYSPTNGDTVWVLISGGALFVCGKAIGFPNF